MAVRFNDLRDFIADLEARGELKPRLIQTLK